MTISSLDENRLNHSLSRSSRSIFCASERVIADEEPGKKLLSKRVLPVTLSCEVSPQGTTQGRLREPSGSRGAPQSLDTRVLCSKRTTREPSGSQAAPQVHRD
jgi:hypothetical protein